MKKTLLFVTLALATLSVKAQTDTTDPGVVINGVKWATRNVDTPGTFAATPESAGMFYQWNRNIGWSNTDPMINSNGGTTWDTTTPTGTEWTPANDPSPTGWRVPTFGEILSLTNPEKVDNVWITQNGVSGRKFTDRANGNSLFLPAVGTRSLFGGSLYDHLTHGRYWSNNPFDTAYAHNIGISSLSAGWTSTWCRSALSVRSVSTSFTNNLPNEIIKEKKIVAFYTIMGIKLNSAPENGMYIVVYDNGTVEKRTK